MCFFFFFVNLRLLDKRINCQFVTQIINNLNEVEIFMLNVLTKKLYLLLLKSNIVNFLMFNPD